MSMCWRTRKSSRTYIDGELIGGSDIVLELLEKGELEPMIKEAIAKKKAAS